MTRSALRSGPSRGIAFALLAAGLTLLAASPASAKKKKAASSTDSTDVQQATDSTEAAPVANEKPAAQADDTEKPKVTADQNQAAPKTDSLGHVHFASPNGEGLGRVTVNAPAKENVKVFLEGRLFGTAPITIYSVPKGDYIVEATYPSGKDVSKPVTVSENEETTVDLATTPLKPGNAEGSGGGGGEISSGRKTLMYGFLVGAAAGIVLGTTFGILDLQAESDYNKATTQSDRDSIQNRGQRDAAVADVGWVLTAVGLVGAGICALPLIFGGEKTPASNGSAGPGTSSAFMFAPVAGRGVTGASMMLRF